MQYTGSEIILNMCKSFVKPLQEEKATQNKYFNHYSVLEFVYKLINTYDIFFKVITKENVYSSDYG